MRKEVEMYLIALLLLGIVFLFAFFQPGGFTGTGFAVYEQSSQGEFDLGTYNATVYDSNSSSITLSENETQGTYLSRIFDSNNTNTTWNNITYAGNEISFEVRACDSSDCSNESFSSADLNNLGLVAQYFQYKAILSQPVNGTASLSSVSIDYSVPQTQETQEQNVSITMHSPTGEVNTMTGIPLEFTTTGSNLTCWYNLDGGNDTTLLNCANTTLDVSSESSYTLNIYANGSTLENDTSTFYVIIPTCSTDLTLCETETECTDEGGYWYNEQCNTEEETTDEETTEETEEPVEEPVEEPTQPETTVQRVTQMSISQVSNQGMNPGQSKTFSINAKNEGNTALSSCKLSVSGLPEGWASVTDKSVSLNPSESKSLSFTLNIPEDRGATTHTVKTDVICSQKSATSSFNLEIIPITFDFNLTDVRKIRSDEVRATYDLIDLSGQDQVVNLKFALFDNTSVKVSEATDNVNLSANESDSFRSTIPINETIEGNLTISVEANAQKYTESVNEPIVLGGAPFLGFVVLGDVFMGTGGVVLLAVVILALLAIVLTVRRIRKKSSNLKK